MTARVLTVDDVLPPDRYALERRAHKARIGEIKRRRRVPVGPFVTFYFENYDTMWLQVQEMLHIERGGWAQAADEVAAYAPLVPNGQELVATFMIEIDDADRRARELGRLGAIEDTTFLRFGSAHVSGAPEMDQERTNAEGKASSVQFVHFPFTAAEIAEFAAPGMEVVLGLNHTHYRHMAVLPEEVRTALTGDFAT